MKKQNVLQAWLVLLLALPKGILAFVLAVVGISAGLPLILVGVGIPLLAATLTACSWMMKQEAAAVGRWMQGEKPPTGPIDVIPPLQWSGWRSLLSLLGQGQTYRGILFSLAQLPIGIAGFTFAIVLPATAFGVLLSPAAYWVSDRFFSFDLFSTNSFLYYLLPDLTSYERSWISGGIGLVLVLLLPILLRALGRLYATWVQWAARTYA